jgi:hypothetical protein
MQDLLAAAMIHCRLLAPGRGGGNGQTGIWGGTRPRSSGIRTFSGVPVAGAVQAFGWGGHQGGLQGGSLGSGSEEG